MNNSVPAADEVSVSDPRYLDPIWRLESLFDSIHTMLPSAPDSGVRVASGWRNGMEIVAYATDGRVQGGAVGGAASKLISEAYEMAIASGVPIVSIWHCGGARLAEGWEAMHGVGEMFAAQVRASGQIPQISVVVGPTAGGAAYGAALSDLVIMVEQAHIFITGPGVVHSVTAEQVSSDDLGGLGVHARKSGVAQVPARDLAHAYELVQTAADLLSRPGKVSAAVDDIDFGALLPEKTERAYDVHDLVQAVFDEGKPVLEVHQFWAPNMVTALGRLGGGSVGVVANNPLRLGGCIDSQAAEKAARFVRMCDDFGIPLVVLADVPGFLPGTHQEWGGIVRRGAKLLYAFCEAVVPRVTVVTRKAYGGSFIAMNSAGMGATRVLAWPQAQVAVMGDIAAIRILRRRELAQVAAKDRAQVEQEMAAEHAASSGGLERAVEQGIIHEIVQPGNTRSRLAAIIAEHQKHALHGQHGNIPL